VHADILFTFYIMRDWIFSIVTPFISLTTCLSLCAVLCATLYVTFYKKQGRIALKGKGAWCRFPLVDKRPVTHNTSIYRFQLPDPDMCLGLHIGQHIVIRAMLNGSFVQRNYTPISMDNQKGHFDLLIKTYPNGNISKYVDEMKLGEFIEVSGPRGRYSYTANKKTQLCMIAGGTGITPMLQIIRHILADPNDNTDLYLIFGNVTVRDILLKEELDRLADENPKRLKIHYTVDHDPSKENAKVSWNGGVGFITEAVIKQNFPPPHPDIQVLICGPPPMVSSVSNACISIGYKASDSLSSPSDMIFKF
jgi:cytochrome-b5 reductase